MKDISKLKEQFLNLKLYLYKKISNFTNNNIVAKTIVIFIIWVIALIPVWIYCFINWLISPETFWQGFAIFSICLIIFGLPQILFMILAGVISLMIILDEI